MRLSGHLNARGGPRTLNCPGAPHFRSSSVRQHSGLQLATKRICFAEHLVLTAPAACGQRIKLTNSPAPRPPLANSPSLLTTDSAASDRMPLAILGDHVVLVDDVAFFALLDAGQRLRHAFLPYFHVSRITAGGTDALVLREVMDQLAAFAKRREQRFKEHLVRRPGFPLPPEQPIAILVFRTIEKPAARLQNSYSLLQLGGSLPPITALRHGLPPSTRHCTLGVH